MRARLNGRYRLACFCGRSPTHGGQALLIAAGWPPSGHCAQRRAPFWCTRRAPLVHSAVHDRPTYTLVLSFLHCIRHHTLLHSPSLASVTDPRPCASSSIAVEAGAVSLSCRPLPSPSLFSWPPQSWRLRTAASTMLRFPQTLVCAPRGLQKQARTHATSPSVAVACTCLGLWRRERLATSQTARARTAGRDRHVQVGCGQVVLFGGWGWFKLTM